MRDLLAAGGRRELARWARQPLLLAFDYDGTLAPIRRDPSRAVPRARTRALLLELTQAAPVVVISGRARGDVRRLLHGTGVRRVIGNHGAELRPPSPAVRRRALRWTRRLAFLLADVPGVQLEDKGFSISVHYRAAANPATARRRILSAVETLAGARVVGGKRVVNVTSAGAPDKGAALLAELRRSGCAAALYVGDDDTDEDVFARSPPAPILTVRVGRRRTSRASYYVADQRRVDTLLSALLAALP